MAMGNWFRARRKDLITHTLIVGGFLCFLLLLSEPLFALLDRGESEAIPGESQLMDISVPDETGNIRYWFESIVTGTTVEFMGWAFIEGDSPADSTTHLVFKCDQHTYVFQTGIQESGQLNQILEIEEPDLTKAGFVATIPGARLENGTYAVGIYIRKDETEALQFSDEVLRRTEAAVELSRE